MAFTQPPFTIGIEEEYLLVDKETRDVASDPPEALFETCQKRVEGLVTHEFLKAQIEVNTKVCETVAEARENLAAVRNTVAGKLAGALVIPRMPKRAPEHNIHF